MIGLDTNVLMRYFMQDDAAQSAAAAKEIDEAIRQGIKMVVNPTVLCEFVWVLASAYGRDRGEIASAVGRVLSIAQFEVLEKDLLLNALEDYRRGPGDFADYYIGRRNRQAGAEYTLTFDRHLNAAKHFHVLER